MSGDHNDKSILERTREALGDEHVPPDVARRLRLARAAAVECVGESTTAYSAYRWAIPAGAAAVALLAVALLRQPGSDLVLPELAEDEMSAAMELELLEDMEFLAWMLEQDPDAG